MGLTYSERRQYLELMAKAGVTDKKLLKIVRVDVDRKTVEKIEAMLTREGRCTVVCGAKGLVVFSYDGYESRLKAGTDNLRAHRERGAVQEAEV